MKTLITSLLAAFTLMLSLPLAAQSNDPVKVGMAGFTFVNFGIDTTIAIMNKLDVKYLCIKDFHLPLNSTDEQMAAFRKKLAAKNIVPYAVGPIYMNSEAEIDRAFDYAKRFGVGLIVAVPKYELLPYVNDMVKKHDMRIAIHLHGPDGMPYPNATDAWNRIKDMDARMGICLDIGHTLRDGHDPILDMKRYRSRIFDIHIKDVTDNSKAGTAIQMGRGLIDIPAFVKVLLKVKYDGVCSLEYEKDMRDPMLGIAESIGYFNGVIDAVK